MPTPSSIKLNSINKNENNDSKISDNDFESDSSADNEQHAYTGNEEIEVEFEGRNPIDSDIDGIQQLLHQLFLKAHVDLSEMANLIIEQNYIGSVIVQSEIDGDETEEDDDIYDANVIFGITSVINITHKKDKECITQLKSYIIDKSKNDLTDNAKQVQLETILNNDNHSVGFIINERFINIPAQISLPLFENLCKEIKRANEKNMNYNFHYCIMPIKFYRRLMPPTEDIYSNPEEEIICKKAIFSFEYSVQTEADTGVSGNWLENDNSLIPYRKFIVFEGNKLPEIVTSIREFLNE